MLGYDETPCEKMQVNERETQGKKEYENHPLPQVERVVGNVTRRGLSPTVASKR